MRKVSGMPLSGNDCTFQKGCQISNQCKISYIKAIYIFNISINSSLSYIYNDIKIMGFEHKLGLI